MKRMGNQTFEQWLASDVSPLGDGDDNQGVSAGNEPPSTSAFAPPPPHPDAKHIVLLCAILISEPNIYMCLYLKIRTTIDNEPFCDTHIYVTPMTWHMTFWGMTKMYMFETMTKDQQDKTTRSKRRLEIPVIRQPKMVQTHQGVRETQMPSGIGKKKRESASHFFVGSLYRNRNPSPKTKERKKEATHRATGKTKRYPFPPKNRNNKMTKGHH